MRFPSIINNPSTPVLVRMMVLMLLAATLGILHQHLGMIQFGGMDGSALIQGAWRYALDQKTYLDYICNAPPIFIVPPGLMFKWFGPSWVNLVTLGTVFTTITFFLMVWIFRRMGWPFILSVGFAFAVESFTMIPLGWWGYNQLAQVAGVIFIGSAELLMKRPGSITNRALYTCSLVLLSWMKPNVAGFLILSEFLVCLINKKSRWVALSLSILATLLSVGLMLLTNINPLDLVNSYLSASGRISNKFMFSECSWFVGSDIGVILVLLIPVTVAAFLKFNGILVNKDADLKQVLPTLLLGSVAMTGAVIAKISNVDNYLTDVSLFFFGLILIIYSTTSGKTVQTEQHANSCAQAPDLQGALVASSLTLLIFFSLISAVARERIKQIGDQAFFQHKQLEPITAPEFFKGMEASPIFKGVLSEINKIVGLTRSDKKPLDSVFFGIRMEFGYAAYNCIPRKGLFLWWPTPGEVKDAVNDDVLKRFVEWSPKTCILFRGDITYMPNEIVKFLNANYEGSVIGDITVLIKKD